MFDVDRDNSIALLYVALMRLAVELYGFTVKETAAGLAKYLETISRHVSRAAERRVEDRGFHELARRVGPIIARSSQID
jgi:hypothetical protein